MSLVSSLFESLRRKKSEVQAQVKRDWKQFVIEVPTGQETDEEAVLIALEQFNKSPDDLQREVENLQRRMEQAEKVRVAKIAETEISAIQAEIDRLDADFDAATKAYEHSLNGPVEKLDLRRRQVTEGNSAKNSLIAGAGPEAQQRLTSAINEVRSLGSELSDLADQLRRAEETLRHWNLTHKGRWSDTMTGPSDEFAAKHKNQCDQMEREISKFRQKIEGATQQLKTAEQSEREVRESLTDPLDFL